jgi:photosystem II stability/assembly factor-like uncharacterized protein
MIIFSEGNLLKKLVLLLILLLILSLQIFAQQNFWEPTSPFQYGYVKTLAVNFNNYIFAGTEYEGILSSSDNGDHWETKNNGIETTSISFIKIDSDNNIFVGEESGNKKLYRSNDNGENWTEFINLITNDNPIRSLVINSDNYLFAGSYGSGIFRSTDDGESWIQINNGLTSLLITALAINSNNDIFAGTLGSGIFCSTDNGENWILKNNGLNNGFIKCIIINGDDYIFAGTNDGLFFSSNFGDNWLERSNGLLSKIVNSLAINSTNMILLGSFDGVYRSIDNGEYWDSRNSGLTDNFISSLTYNSNDVAFAGTMGDGVFRSINSTTSIEIEENNIPSSYTLSQNYPNPFNPITKISYQLPTAAHVEIKVFDVLGNEVANLVNEEKPAGSYELQFDGNGLTSGIYFYQLKAGDYIVTKKMILLK